MKSFYLTPLTKMLGVGFSLLATLLACQLGDVSVQPPAQSSSQLPLQHRLTFKRSPDWLQTANGQNLIAHGVISDPSILYENGRYRMWFTAALHPYTNAQELGMAYAESQDGQVWQPHVNPETGEPLLLLRPTPGGWDAEGVETPSVIKTPLLTGLV
jgi:hypothetical protein